MNAYARFKNTEGLLLHVYIDFSGILIDYWMSVSKPMQSAVTRAASDAQGLSKVGIS